jgi:predicted nucleic acid-binding protein
MGVYYFDTSSLLKRYLDEPGRSKVLEICRPSAGHTLIISRLTTTEIVSALCLRARRTEPSLRIETWERDEHIAAFRRHIGRLFAVVEMTEAICTEAADLCRAYELRAGDSIQLATALAVQRTYQPVGVAPTFVLNDDRVLDACPNMGLVVERPV